MGRASKDIGSYWREMFKVILLMYKIIKKHIHASIIPDSYDHLANLTGFFYCGKKYILCCFVFA